ncbi:MAG: acylneuraminate cytidylyltransferase family protein [Candidatus Marinimicrobia bacterium]|nr:acylneuraminate cytidylyltransferase family protein [Candidatus Neomarinimicrobiota bacterium]MCF7828753.1 acylneuraminate cytidylyltransferase family protein [Candidatus Neomarinimicrobiota bacterium]MCF7880670.1 acylneuraminate cytidylyltransferase family protein [Candidatus Neomarinimicrobiota bacterium]
MINSKRILAVIPARKGSKGLPGKNKKNLLGKPLVLYPIETAKNSKYVDEIFLTTDDIEIQEIGLSEDISCPEMRPPKFSSDTASSFSVIKYVINYYKKNNKDFQYIVLLEPTSPLTEHTDIDNALEILDNSRDVADSIVGVARVESQHPKFIVGLTSNNIIKPYLSGFSSLRRQEIERLFYYDGSFYISDTKVLLNEKSFYHERCIGFEMPKSKSFEVDDMIDFLCVESILKNNEKIK